MFVVTENDDTPKDCADNVKPSESDGAVDWTKPTGTAKEVDKNNFDTSGGFLRIWQQYWKIAIRR